jgi:hypothetical protein
MTTIQNGGVGANVVSMILQNLLASMRTAIRRPISAIEDMLTNATQPLTNFVVVLYANNGQPLSVFAGYDGQVRDRAFARMISSGEAGGFSVIDFGIEGAVLTQMYSESVTQIFASVIPFSNVEMNLDGSTAVANGVAPKIPGARRGPGRPKGSGNKAAAAATAAPAKRGPGRPKGSGKKAAAATAKRGPGRPKGSGKKAAAVDAAPTKRSPGRPKGSGKKAAAVAAAPAVKKGPGRPKGSGKKAAKRGPGRPRGSSNKATAPVDAAPATAPVVAANQPSMFDTPMGAIISGQGARPGRPRKTTAAVAAA